MPELSWNPGSAGGLAAGGFRRTRPRPVSGAVHQPRVYRIRLDISNHRSKLFTGADPPVEILALPKSLPRPSCEAVGANGGARFKPAQDLAELLVRLHNHVNVIGHHYPCQKIVIAPGVLTMQQRLDKGCCNCGILQPSRSLARPVQLAIMHKESPSRVGILDQRCGLGLWKRARQAPSDKDDRVVRRPMRKFSVSEHDSPRNRRQDRRCYLVLQDRRCYRDGVGARCSFSVKLSR
jgi:hypothetical protein